MHFLRFVAVATFALGAATSAAQTTTTINVAMPNCTAVALTGTAPNYQLVCTEQVQSCIVNSNPASPNGNTQATLSAACSPAATSVTWQASRDCATPTVQAGSPLTATVTEPIGGRSCVYTATANGGGSGAATVVWQGPGTAPPANAPTGCAIARTPATGTLTATGGPVALQGSCSGGGAVSEWRWRKNTLSGWSTLQSPTDTLPNNAGASPVTYTYGLTACAGGGSATACANEVATTFVVVGSQPVGQCGQFGDVVTVDLPWGGQVDTYSNGGMRPDTIVVARLQVPPGALTGSIRQGRTSWVEYDGAPIQRVVSLSTEPCDFRGWTTVDYPTDPTGTTAPLKWGIGQTGDILWGLQGGVGSPPLVPGQTYFFNVRNQNPFNGQNSCTAANCNIRLTVSPFF